jgi:hypothetical protein
VKLRRCHRWFAVEIESHRQTPPRHEMRCRVVDSALELPFFGFNRAKHAVIEAAILATRTHLLPAAEIRAQVDAWQPLVDKTAGPAEQRAFDLLVREIETRLEQPAASGTE